MRRVISGQFEVELPAADAIGLFTPEGERDWVAGWNPVYVAADASETAGTVFITDAHGANTIWLIVEIDRRRCVAAYARVTPGHHAGTVRVNCTDASAGRSIVSVTYDMSLLPGADSSGLDGYDEPRFDAMMDHWAHAVGAFLATT